MNIGLLDIDCHAAKKKWGATVYPNLALAKISAWHKQQGDVVEWANPFDHYDILYRSKIFTFSEDDYTPYNADQVVSGGTGYSLDTILPKHIDDMQPDLSIYPHLPGDTAYGFLTRGCPNKCKWCVVPRKEGNITPYWDVDRVANGKKKIVLMDNNILAAGDYGKNQVRKIIDRGYRVDFNQAIDARLMTDEWADLLSHVKWIDSTIRFGCDTPGQIAECKRAIEMLESRGFKGEFFLYCMLNADFNEALNRVNYWWVYEQCTRVQGISRCHVYAYAQPFRDPYNRKAIIPQWQKDMAGWVNKKAHFVAHSFEEFEPRKGFTCRTYTEQYKQ